ncbi:carbohydrate ABC transporter permease [Streptomyces decoyicus]|uniref:carbohydrate ABC transporter permease n=1 Tax=Streptomyces decoyicus TaxID=249567 RepID=UPI00362A6B19
MSAPTASAQTASTSGGRRREGRVRRPVLYVLASLGLLVMSAPFLWMALSAFKTRQDLTASPPVWIPSRWTLGNFSALLDQLDMPLYFVNSLVVAVFVTVCNLLFCSMLGYALAKLDFTGRSKVFGTVLAALMVPGNLLVLYVGTRNAGAVFVCRARHRARARDTASAGPDLLSPTHQLWRRTVRPRPPRRASRSRRSRARPRALADRRRDPTAEGRLHLYRHIHLLSDAALSTDPVVRGRAASRLDASRSSPRPAGR